MKRLDLVFPGLTYILLATTDKKEWQIAKKSGLLAGGSEEYTIDATRPAYTHFSDAIVVVNSLNKSEPENNKELNLDRG